MNDFLPTLGWDLGGAHLKAVLVGADGRVLQVFQQPCPLWMGLDHLERALEAVMSAFAATDIRHAVTMTGELADIFASRREGVALLAQYMADRLGADAVCFYAGPCGFVKIGEVNQYLADIASANWHASAVFLGAKIPDALFLDVGSTTADMIVLNRGEPAIHGCSDAERLRHEELIYTGVVRTPVMAVAQRVPFDGEWQSLAAEHFATMADVYRLTGDLPADYDMVQTADGSGKSPEESARRLARMVGRDLVDATMSQWRELALTIKSHQMRLLQIAAERALSRGMLNDDAPMIGAGAGRFLVEELARNMGRPSRNASTLIPALPDVAEWAAICLPAYAVAWLAMQEDAWQQC